MSKWRHRWLPIRALVLLSLSLLMVSASCVSNERSTPAPTLQVSSGLLAFGVRDGDEGESIWVVDTQGELVNTLGRGRDPYWSPDGRKLLVSYRGIVEIYEWETGRLLETIEVPPSTVENNPRHQDVAWGPGGETILFARYEGLYLTRIGSTELELLLECEWQCWSVAWSPDGEKIAFVERDVGPAGRVEEDVTYLKILDTADGTFRVLLTLHSMAEPVWSPDSAKLAFLGTLSQENRGGLYTLDLDSGELRLIVPNPGPTGITRITHMEVPMSWSPDGSQIAYAWIVEDSSDIYYNEIRVVDVVTLESMTIWKEEDPIRLLSGPDWRGEP